ncbi:MAG TPA: toxin HicA [Myxococcota bacterium]|nr:toxin HicA [Myxococcota bacterium]
MGQSIEELLAKFELSQQNVRFSDLVKVCDTLFGQPRQSGTSHRVYKTPWQGDPRVNIQNDKGKAKPYQVKQVLRAVEKMKEESDA